MEDTEKHGEARLETASGDRIVSYSIDPRESRDWQISAITTGRVWIPDTAQTLALPRAGRLCGTIHGDLHVLLDGLSSDHRSARFVAVEVRSDPDAGNQAVN